MTPLAADKDNSRSMIPEAIAVATRNQVPTDLV